MARPVKLTPLAIAVLELLHERPMHPYELTQLMRERQMDLRVGIKVGSLYHAIDRLLACEFIEVVDTQRAGRRPERTVYGATAAGRRAFTARAKELLGTVAEEYPEYVSGLALIDDLDQADVHTELVRRIGTLAEQLAAHEAVERELRERELPEMYWLDCRFVRARTAFELNWTRELLHDLETGRITVPVCATPEPDTQSTSGTESAKESESDAESGRPATSENHSSSKDTDHARTDPAARAVR